MNLNNLFRFRKKEKRRKYVSKFTNKQGKQKQKYYKFVKFYQKQRT